MCVKNKSIVVNYEDIREVPWSEHVAERSEIQLPGWRVAGPGDGLGEEGVEDLSDAACSRRHERAELEEQALWARWQEQRAREGRAVSGRCGQAGWREPDLAPDTPRLRSHTAPGVEQVREILVLPATPPQLSPALHKPSDTSNRTQSQFVFGSPVGREGPRRGSRDPGRQDRRPGGRAGSKENIVCQLRTLAAADPSRKSPQRLLRVLQEKQRNVHQAGR